MKGSTALTGQPPRRELPAPNTGGATAPVEVEHSPAVEAEVSAAIEAILLWSRQALGGLIGLGELTRYLDSGGPLGLVASRLNHELERTEAALAELPQLLDRLRRAAHLGATRR